MTLNDTRISARLMLGFGVLMALIVLMGAIALVKIGVVEASFRTVIAERYPTVVAAHEIQNDLNVVASSMRNSLILVEPARVQHELDGAREAQERIARSCRDLEGQLQSDSGRAVFAAFVAVHERFDPLQAQFAQQVLAGQTEEALTLLMGSLESAQRDYFAAIESVIELQAGMMSEAAAQTSGAVISVRAVTWSVGLMALLLATLVGAWIIRSITRPINQAVAIARAVSAGDLSIEFAAAGSNETAQLLLALKEMQRNLASVVSNVRLNSDSVALASTQIAQGNSDLSQRTEEQAVALQRTTLSMEELGDTVRKNAEHAQQAHQLAANASVTATAGGNVVQQMIETMQGIDGSSRRVVDIIAVINEISFQTNLLALNAAVEAARAGDQGRGFAVVAAEVRGLAQRSANAAKEIRDLITENVDRVSQGTALVAQAGRTMTEVVEAIQRMTTLMSEISAASAEQSSGVAQIGEAIGHLDATTQQNASLVQESAAAAESLQSQAHELVQSVAVFKLGAARQTSAPEFPHPVSSKWSPADEKHSRPDTARVHEHRRLAGVG